LFSWLEHFRNPHPRLYLVHGESNAKLAFHEFLSGKGWPATIPGKGEAITF
jgi:metallo-beta-lactamase family protein